MTDLDPTTVDRIVAEIGMGAEKLIPILQAIQRSFGYLPAEAMERVCEITDITPAAVAGVSTFYSQFRHRPAGRYTVRVCHGTACHVKGAAQATEAIMRHLGISGEDDTDADGLFTVEKVACLGCCTLAPVVQIDDVTYGHVTADRAPTIIRDFLELQRARPRNRPSRRGARSARAEIRIGLGSCCIARGSERVRDALDEAVAACAADVKLKAVGCVGMCHQTPLVEVVVGGASFLYARVQPGDAAAIVRRHFRPAGLGGRLRSATSAGLDRVLTDRAWQGVAHYSIDVRDEQVSAFLAPQQRVATELSGQINPTDLDEYVRNGGLEALERAAAMPAEDICRTISASGLRGRGGAGYPTGAKWDAVRTAAGATKYVICNGDEGDPGAFMDRMLLESYPYRVLEGIIVAARAVGAAEGILYIRAEYPMAVRRVTTAIEALRGRGVLGDGAGREGAAMELRIMEGAGAFVCGEETALLASIEGRRGMPRIRPPYPSQSGLWGAPTLIGNVETFASVPWIIRHGPGSFAAMGTATSKGTKVFALAGKVRRGGLIEVPMGATIRRIVDEIGGGTADGTPFKAVQVGGPSGGCVPAALADTPIDYEALNSVGAIMGSGGLVVLDRTDCMVDIARYFLQFTQDQSCGKCTFCRVGTRRMLEILTRLCTGGGRAGDLERLEELARLVASSSLCGLGKTAPNPVLSTLRHFRDEYEAHVAGRCPAGRCRDLVTYRITDDCIGCTICAQKCPAGAIAPRPHHKHEIDPDKCVRCGTCKAACPVDAVEVQ
jgi:NADH-quinone oxidoreductase subunit F